MRRSSPKGRTTGSPWARRAGRRRISPRNDSAAGWPPSPQAGSPRAACPGSAWPRARGRRPSAPRRLRPGPSAPWSARRVVDRASKTGRAATRGRTAPRPRRRRAWSAIGGPGTSVHSPRLVAGRFAVAFEYFILNIEFRIRNSESRISGIQDSGFRIPVPSPSAPASSAVAGPGKRGAGPPASISANSR